MFDPVTGEVKTTLPSNYDSYVKKDEWEKFIEITLSPAFKVCV